jgi:hypothetical protein
MNWIKNPNTKLIYGTINFVPNLAKLSLYKLQIRWFRDTELFFKNINIQLSKHYGQMVKLLRKNLKFMAR